MISSKFSQHFRRCYIEFIEYFNEHQLSQSSISFLFLFQSLSISCALLSIVSNDEPFFTLALFGVANTLKTVSDLSYWIQICIICLMLCLLAVPFFILIQLVFQGFGSNHTKNGEFKKQCQLSIFHSLIRSYLISFEYIFLPTHLFYFFKSSNIILSIIVCVLSLLTVVFVDYHILEIIYKENNRIIKLNFPYKLIDTFILIATIFFSSKQTQTYALVAASVGNFIRLLITFFLDYYTQSIMGKNQFYLILNQILLLGFILALRSQSPNIFLYNAFFLVAIIFWKRTSIIKLIQSFKKTKEGISQIDEQLQSLEASLKIKQLANIQMKFQKEGNFAGIYRRLIIMGKKSIQNRQYLTIQILKSKCYGIQISSRGTAAKIMDCQAVMNYENLLKEIVCLILQISSRTISILKLTKMREQYIYIFNEQVQNLIGFVVKIKKLIRQLMKINEWSIEGQVILTIMFGHIMKDDIFLDQIKSLRKINKKQSDKNLKIHLFNEKTVMVFVNMLDEMGKIVKTSKNLPTILGYNPNQLQGIQIDSLLMTSMRVFHIQHMTNFIENYDKRRALNPRNVLFYINNHNYELQKIDVGYSFVMSSFNLFHLCGIINKTELQGEVIIVNKFGNLEGCTKKIGIDLGISTVIGPYISKINFLCLIPALLKHEDKPIKIRTIIFRVKNIQSNAWLLNQEQKSALSKLDIRQYQYQLFLRLLQDDIIDAYLADIDVSNYEFFHQQVALKVIIVKNYQKIMNFCFIKQKIENRFNKYAIQEETELKTYGETEMNLILNENQKKKFDTNFTLDINHHSIIKLRQIQIDTLEIQDQRYFDVMDLLTSQLQTNSPDKLTKEVENTSHNSQHKIARNWKCVDILTVLIVGFIAFIIIDYFHLRGKVDELYAFNKQIIKNNKALSIILKSLYSPTKSDIDNFNYNQLVNPFEKLLEYEFSYSTFYNTTVTYNSHYLFNIHIPTLLKRILFQNQTLSSQAKIQLSINIKNIITSSDFFSKQFMKQWETEIDKVLLIYHITLVTIIISMTTILVIGTCMVVFRRKQLITYEAFFKFEKNDIQQKIGDIKAEIKDLESQVMKWYLLKEFQNYVKQGNIFNLQFQSINAIYEPKVGFQVSNEKELSIKNGQLYRYIVYLGGFVIVQVLLCLLYVNQTTTFISDSRLIPKEIEQCSKSLVSPNYLLASINRTLPNSIRVQYIQSTQTCLSKSVSSLPALLNFSQTAPCVNCTFLYPYLTTNYLSYFNSFKEMVLMMNEGTPTFSFHEMVQSASVFTANLEQQLYKWLQLSPSKYAPICYMLCVVIIGVVTIVNIGKINEEIKCVQIFLMFYRKQIIQNNMRMDSLLEKKE